MIFYYFIIYWEKNTKKRKEKLSGQRRRWFYPDGFPSSRWLRVPTSFSDDILSFVVSPLPLVGWDSPLLSDALVSKADPLTKLLRCVSLPLIESWIKLQSPTRCSVSFFPILIGFNGKSQFKVGCFWNWTVGEWRRSVLGFVITSSMGREEHMEHICSLHVLSAHSSQFWGFIHCCQHTPPKASRSSDSSESPFFFCLEGFTIQVISLLPWDAIGYSRSVKPSLCHCWFFPIDIHGLATQYRCCHLWFSKW